MFVMPGRIVKLVVLLLFFSEIILAQKLSVGGLILSEKDRLPIAYSTVMIKESGQWAVSDDKGEFLIKNVQKGTCTVVIRSLGYVSRTFTLKVVDESKKLRILLKEENRISYNADPNRYDELNPIIYQQIANIAQHGPVSSSLAKVKEYLKKQYAQMAITNDYWSYVIWHQLRDGEDFDKDYVKMVDEISSADIQKLAADILRQNHRIEVTMLSAK